MLRIAFFVLSLLPALSIADEAAIRRVLEPKLGGVRIDAVQPAPLPGLFEVRFQTADGPRIVYTDAAGNYVIQGSIYDMRAQRNLTEERLRKLSAIKFDTLPLDQAVKIQRGNGKRTLVMFSDPYCPACKQFEQVLQQVDDITVYVFMYPVIRPENADHSKAVWCAPDKTKAWLDLALRGRRSAISTACDSPLEKNLQLGRKLGVNSTPTLFFVNGERVAGGLPAPDLREMLDDAAKSR
jgi:thiol:disulfide interchange protein DsbC